MLARILFLIVIMPCLAFASAMAQSFDSMVNEMDEKSLPQVNIEVTLDSINRTSYTLGKVTIAQFCDSAVVTEVYNGLLRYRGMSAYYNDKKSFALKIVDDDGEDLDANILGLRSDHSWILDAMAIDRVRMRNRVCFDIWNEISRTPWETKYNNRNGTLGKMVEVYINGNYNGIYCLTDKINRKLLNLRKAKMDADSTLTIKGLLYKGTNKKASNFLTTYEEDRLDTLVWNSFELQYPDDYPSPATWQPLMDIIDFNSLTGDEDFAQQYQQWYYLDNLVDYWVFIVAFNIQDMPYKNTFLSTPDITFEHRYLLTPWDLDASLGGYYDGTYLDFYAWLERLDKYGPFNRVVVNNLDNIRHRIAMRWRQLSPTTLAPAHVEEVINGYAQQFIESGAWQREQAKWRNNPVPLKANLLDETTYVIDWYTRNHAFMTQELEQWLLPGDVNCDNTVTGSDITAIYNYILLGDDSYLGTADVNGDGEVTASDITAIYNIILGTDPQEE